MSDNLPAERPANGASSPPPPPNAKPLSDMRSQLTQLPVETQNHVLAEYRERRTNFRDWLLAQLVEGVHFGFPPGLMPKTKVISGVTHFEQKTRNGSSWIPETQWKPRPSLYKAGADFVIELMAVRDSYAPDADVWKMMGGKPNEVCMRCDLFDRVSGEKIADGHGFGSRGGRADFEGKGANTAIKMASKRAKVAAVLNAFGLADLFTQDIEDLGSETPEQTIQNPRQAENAPTVPPRQDADSAPGPKGIGPVSVEELRMLFSRWVKIGKAEAAQFGEEPKVTKQAFVAFLATSMHKEESEALLDPQSWSRDEIRKIERSFRTSEEALGL